jgi:hypothetical protein
MQLVSMLSKFVNCIAFYSFNTGSAEGWALCQKYGILNLPALACFIQGEHRETIIGCRSERALEAKFKEWLKEGVN